MYTCSNKKEIIISQVLSRKGKNIHTHTLEREISLAVNQIPAKEL